VPQQEPLVQQLRVVGDEFGERRESMVRDCCGHQVHPGARQRVVVERRPPVVLREKPQMVKLILKEAFGISIGGPKVQPAP
jgi:hypothetical protein